MGDVGDEVDVVDVGDVGDGLATGGAWPAGSEEVGLEADRRRHPRAGDQKTDGEAGIVKNGTEVINDEKRPISALLGASQGASVLLRRSSPKRVRRLIVEGAFR